MLRIETLSARDAAPHREGVLSVWRDVFGDVADPDAWRTSLWDRHRTRAGYRLVLAREDQRMLGFAWGYTGERGQYWSDRIVREGGADVSGWVGGHFEVVELAVTPTARRTGVGTRLLDALLAGLRHDRALLETSAAPDDPAARLYTRRGWVRLAALDSERQVMGLRLRTDRSED